MLDAGEPDAAGGDNDAAGGGDDAGDGEAADASEDMGEPSDAASGFPAEEGAPADGDGRVRVGQGQVSFTELRHGDTVRWERGPQRGHHVYLRWQSADAWLDEVPEDLRSRLRWEIRVEDGTGLRLGSLQRTGGFRRGDDGIWRSDLAQVILVNGIRPGSLDAVPLQVSVRLWGDGLTTDVRRWVWVRSFCCD
jgi:hypothetical protein